MQTAVYAFHLLLLHLHLLLPIELLPLVTLMVIGCRPHPPDGGQAAIFETLGKIFLKT